MIVRTFFSPPAGSSAVLRWEGPFEGGPAYVRVAFGTRYAPGTLPTGEPTYFLMSGARGLMAAERSSAPPSIEEIPSLRAE